MSRHRTGGKRRVDPKAAVQGARHKKRRKLKRSEVEGAEIEQLKKRIQEEAPQSLSAPASNISEPTACSEQEGFENLPISSYTKRALAECNYVKMTAIQKACLPQALCGRDILGAAKTGSGKTLSFIIPVCPCFNRPRVRSYVTSGAWWTSPAGVLQVLETLYRARWSDMDGIGALIISPTRELALQIFDELRKVGKHHSISAGLLIGGKSAEEEAKFVTGGAPRT
jgi:ATP-dependent RNA helicase DDX10/DBP4